MIATVYRDALPSDAPRSLIQKAQDTHMSIGAARREYVKWRRHASSDSYGEAGEFEQLVAQLMASKGLSRREASRFVAKAYPDAHDEFLSRCPPARSSGPT